MRCRTSANRYGPTVAVEDVSFSVGSGEIFGVIGPNGAGKTTAVECVGGLRTRDSGTVSVLGLDPQRERSALRQVVGTQLQEGSMPVRLRVRELVDLFASFYPHPADTSDLLDLLGLASKRNAYYGRLSGGQKQRVAIALALVGKPKVAILDELTTGLDPQARRDTWELVAGIRDRGVTVVLVTHFMDEAERLCDRVMLVEHGQVVALGTPAMLAERHGGGSRLEFPPLPAVRRLTVDRASRGQRAAARRRSGGGQRDRRPPRRRCARTGQGGG